MFCAIASVDVNSVRRKKAPNPLLQLPKFTILPLGLCKRLNRSISTASDEITSQHTKSTNKEYVQNIYSKTCIKSVLTDVEGYKTKLAYNLMCQERRADFEDYTATHFICTSWICFWQHLRFFLFSIVTL